MNLDIKTRTLSKYTIQNFNNWKTREMKLEIKIVYTCAGVKGALDGVAGGEEGDIKEGGIELTEDEKNPDSTLSSSS